MAKVLISFLGKGRSENGRRDYKEATYQFENGELRRTKFFGIALQEVINPDKTVIFGTSGSMWDVFLEDSLLLDVSCEKLDQNRNDLINSAESGTVKQSELDILANFINQQSKHSFQFKLMSEAKNLPEQIGLVHRLIESVEPGDSLYIDVTHSFRHLPMLAMMAAMLLRSLKGVSIQAIYYGALEMTRDNITPVLNLKGLLDIQDWVVGLKFLEETGSIRYLEPVLSEQLNEQSQKELNKSDFNERIMQLGNASRQLSNVHKELSRPSEEGSIFHLVQAELLQLTSWFKEQSLSQKQASRAYFYLEHKDYLRSVIFAMECCISYGVAENQQNHFDSRKAKSDELCKIDSTFRNLSYLRNSLAHAANPQGKAIPDLLKDEPKLALWLNNSYQELTNKSIMPKLAAQGGNK